MRILPIRKITVNWEPHYQADLAELIRVEKPKIVVETGVATGVGSEFILKALDDNGDGHLYSIDSVLDGFLLANPIVHPRWTFIKDTSQKALFPLFQKTGLWDLFLHDSDHEFACQTFEYECAWNCVKPGGIIASDDTTWGDPPHGAWRSFLSHHGLTEFRLGNAIFTRKPQ